MWPLHDLESSLLFSLSLSLSLLDYIVLNTGHFLAIYFAKKFFTAGVHFGQFILIGYSKIIGKPTPETGKPMPDIKDGLRFLNFPAIAFALCFFLFFQPSLLWISHSVFVYFSNFCRHSNCLKLSLVNFRNYILFQNFLNFRLEIHNRKKSEIPLFYINFRNKQQMEAMLKFYYVLLLCSHHYRS